MKRLAMLLAAAALAVLGLSACATGYVLDNEVQTFSSLQAMPAQPTYRFDRLPSQQANPTQATIEAMADGALHQAGLRRDDAAPRYSVQVSAHSARVLSPYADPWGWGGWGGWGQVGIGVGGPLFPRMESPWFRREVSVVMRELGSNRVVYETHARNSGPWLDDRAVLPRMFQAAMQGFPNPPPGPRRVDIYVGPS